VGLGINKDLEPLARRVRKSGGAVEITASNHVRWTTPDGTVTRTGLTMNVRSARNADRTILRVLDAPPSPGPAAQPARSARWTVTPDRRGKFHLVDERGEPVRNAAGYPRTFSSEHDAWAAAGG
jgi:hypothetical protein